MEIFAGALIVLSLSGPAIGGTTVAVTTTLSLLHFTLVLAGGVPGAGQVAAGKKRRSRAEHEDPGSRRQSPVER